MVGSQFFAVVRPSSVAGSVCAVGPRREQIARCLTRAAVVLVLTMVATAASAQDLVPKIPFLDAWRASPHANVKSESFTHWDKDGAVPVACAACHSGPGYLDFLGADGSAAGKVDKPAPVRAVVDCVTCHDIKASALRSVLFPSGRSVGDLGASARCMVCHQGRQSGPDVARATVSLAADAVADTLRFINIHYAVAAGTLFGAEAAAGYEYPGKSYHGRFKHVAGFDGCATCHDPHTTRVRAEACGACHTGGSLGAIREARVDFDGDGDTAEGLAGEIATMHAALGTAILRYAREVAGTPIAYGSATHPYFFHDRDGDGVAGAAEAVRDNAFARWTPRLLRAAYNYHFIAKDRGAWAHNPVYALQVLYDSLEDLSGRVATDVARMRRP